MGRLDWREENMAGSSLEDTFKLFDMEGVNKIKRSDVGNVMRCMKLRPDEGQVAALVDEFASGPEVTLDQMRQIVDKYPSIPRNEFESVMASEAFGHPFSDPEIANLCALLGLDDGADVPIDAMVDKFSEDL